MTLALDFDPVGFRHATPEKPQKSMVPSRVHADKGHDEVDIIVALLVVRLLSALPYGPGYTRGDGTTVDHSVVAAVPEQLHSPGAGGVSPAGARGQRYLVPPWSPVTPQASAVCHLLRSTSPPLSTGPCLARDIEAAPRSLPTCDEDFRDERLLQPPWLLPPEQIRGLAVGHIR